MTGIGRGIGIAAAALALPAAAPAADRVYLRDGAEDVEWLRLRSVSGWTQVQARARRDEAQGFELRETVLSPELHVDTDGSIYHPDLLDFTVGAALRLEDQRVRGDEERDDRVTFGAYDATARVLDHRIVNGSALARRDEAWVESPYRASTRMRTSAAGGELRLRSTVVPASVGWQRDERAEEFRDVTREERHDTVRGSAGHRLGVSRTDASVRWVDTERTFQSQDYRTISASLDNTLRPTADSPHRLQSSARWFNQYGTLRRRDLGVTEDARIQPRADLGAWARWQFTEQADPRAADAAAGRQLVRMNRGDVGVRHELWGSLATTVEVHAARRNAFDGTASDRARVGTVGQRGVRTGVDYRRRTPYGGLNLGFDWERAREEQESRDRSRSVRDESHVLRDGAEPRLENARVNVASIVVTDDTGFVVYEEGLDYTVVPFGSRVAIFRVPSGDIADGQTILVDYVFEYSPDLTFDTTGKTFRFRFDGKRWISVHYRRDRHREDFVSGVANGFLEDQRTHRAGVDLRVAFLSAGDEYEVQKLLGTEFRTNRAYVGADRRIGRALWLQVETAHSRSEFSEVDHVQSIWTASVKVHGTAPGGITLRAEGWTRLDRVNRPEAGSDSDLFGARLELGRRFRAVTASVGAFYRDSDRNDLTDRRSQVYATLRRSFRLGGGGS